MRYGKFLIKVFAVALIFNTSYGESQSFNLETLVKEAKVFKETGKVYFNFEKIDLKLLTYFISELTGKNIIIGSNLKGEVSLVFSQPITINQAWDVYTSILKARNYTVIDKKDYVQIVSASMSRNSVPPLDTEGKKSEELITYVYKLKKADVIHVSNILRGIKSPKGLVFSYNPANVLIITDTASNIENLKKVISIIDTAQTGEEIKIYRLKYANSSEIASALSVIFGDFAKKGLSIKVFNVNSLNTIVVKAPKEAIPKIDNIILSLDLPTENLTLRKFWTLRLKNLKAKDIANVLNKLLQNTTIGHWSWNRTIRSEEVNSRGTSNST